MERLLDLIAPNIQNEFLSGGIVLMILGAIAAYARRLPARAWRFVQARFIVTLDITNEDPAFYWLATWLSRQPYSQRARNLSVTTMRDAYGIGGSNTLPGSDGAPKPEEVHLPDIIFTPAPGNHYFFFKGRPIWLVRSRESSGKEPNSGTFGLFNKESFQVRMIARRQSTARALIEEARQSAVVERKKRTDIYVLSWERFKQVESCDPRPLSSVFLPAGQKEEIIADVQKFLGAKQWYLERGIPWRRGYYFKGLPGTGKTSLIKAIAGHLRLNIYVVSLSSKGLDDRLLQNAMSDLPPRSLILLEDIDATFVEREKNKDVSNSISFAGLANALDGVASREGWLVFMTTNHPEKVDEALTRPGRADKHVDFSYATADQAASIFEAFFPGSVQSEPFGALVAAQRMTMAAVQQHLIFHQKSPVEALAALPVLKEAKAVGAIT